MVSSQGVLSFTYVSQNVATSMPSLTSQSCGDSLLAICLSVQAKAIYRPTKHCQMSDKLKKEASVKADH